MFGTEASIERSLIVAELPPMRLTLSVSQIQIDAFSYSFEAASIHGYDREQSTDAHVYLIVHVIEPLPPPICKTIGIRYPPIEHDAEIQLNLEVVAFMQFGAQVMFKCEALDADLDARLIRMRARPIIELQEALDD